MFPHLIIEVRVLRVMKDSGKGSCGEDWSSWFAIDALKNHLIENELHYKEVIQQYTLDDYLPSRVWQLLHLSSEIPHRRLCYEPVNW